MSTTRLSRIYCHCEIFCVSKNRSNPYALAAIFVLFSLLFPILSFALDLPDLTTFKEAKTGEVIAIVNRNVSNNNSISIQSLKSRSVINPLEKESLAIQASDKFLLQKGSLLGIKNVASELYPETVTTDSLGVTKVKNSQRYNGVKVFGAEIISLINSSNEVLSVNGRIIKNLVLDTNPKITSSRAIKIATKNLESRIGWYRTVAIQKRSLKKFCRNESNSTLCVNKRLKKYTKAFGLYSLKTPELYVYNKNFLNNEVGFNSNLAWSVTILNSEDISEVFFIDAHTGKILSAKETKQSDIFRRIYDCSKPTASNTCWHTLAPGMPNYPTQYDPYIFGRVEGADIRGGNPMEGIFHETTEVDKGYEIAGFIHEYYLLRFGRNGANTQGGTGNGSVAPVEQTRFLVNYNGTNPISCSSGTAWWEPSKSELRFCLGYVDLDIVGHEYAHAVTSYTSGLGNQYEPGALNESNSDVTGQFFEFIKSGNTDWLMLNSNNEPIRNLSNPTSLTYTIEDVGTFPQPDNYNSPSFYCGDLDDHGVHINSTVPSFAAYLAAEGGSNNGCTIQGIGKERVEQIWYSAITTTFTSSTTFNEAYIHYTNACEFLIAHPTPQMIALGINIVTSDCENLAKALQSVEMDKPGGCVQISENVWVPAANDFTPTCATPAFTGDFNGDDVVNLDDYQILRGRWTYPNLAGGQALRQAPPEGDANNDGVVDMLDYNIWRDDFIASHPGITPPPAPTLVGDYDFDGDVDAEDYVIFKQFEGQTAPGLLPDGDVNGVIDREDLLMWAHSTPDHMAGDYNHDDEVNLWDYNTLKKDWNQNAPDLASDINHDNTTDIFDYSVWADVSGLQSLPFVPTIDGDYNGDGWVDSRDYTVWKSGYGSTGPALGMDGNIDGSVDAADYTTWRNNLGNSMYPMASDLDVSDTIDLNDYDAIRKATFGMAPVETGDVNGDGKADYFDYSQWASHYPGAMIPLRPTLPGDANGDGSVTQADFTEWKAHYGETGPGILADLNIDGAVNAADYTVWRDNLGAGVN